MIDRTLGIEAVINHQLHMRVAYQNVDKACDEVFKPLPRSAKGPAAERMCSFPLFDFYEMTLDSDKERLPSEDSRDPYGDLVTTYFVMVGEDGSVEFSCPIIKNKRFSDFRERIFVDQNEDDWENWIESDFDAEEDFDIPVTLKKII
jgi:hypothetical protein